MKNLSEITFSYFIVLVFGTLTLILANQADFPIVKTEEGEVQGKIERSRGGRKYQSFLGIPYAQPPERFEAPKPPLKWKGVRNCTELRDVCVQDVWMFDYVQTIDGSEDCLFINLQTRNANSKSTEKFPVIVFFHGGGFNFGAGNDYEGKYFMDHDVVFVTVNYRLGAFGFLDTEDGVVGGNNGMKDQVLALKWIQRNIEHFGGNPNLVTILGHSAGGASVTYHMISPMSKGLFHRVFALSGSALSPWAYFTQPRYMAERLGAKLNCPTGSTKDLVECLKTRDAREFAEIHFRRWNLDTAIPFSPTKEVPLQSNSKDHEIFLNEDPFKILQEGRFAKVPVIMSILEDEGLLYHAAIVLQSKKSTKELDEDWNRIAPITLLYDKYEHRVTEEQQNERSRRIREFYFGDKRVGLDTSRELINCYSDRWFVHSVRTAARLLADKSTKDSPVYTLVMTYRGEHPAVASIGAEDTSGIYSAATHADELAFLFNTKNFPNPLSKRSEEYSKRLVSILVDFAYNGQLFVDGKLLKPLAPNKEPDWYELNERSVQLLENPFPERMQFWDDILNYQMKTDKTKTEL